ncbi:MAG: response regulator [Flammeovirgaceae bacterium]|nr:MAG: response regulator [Flammeovirgaceae bacterium]
MNNIRIAIVEDEFVIAEDISSLLHNHGYHVTGVYPSAEIALPEILKQPPDLMLVDINLAGALNGIYLVSKISERMEVPVIYITANSDPETYNRAKSTKPNAFLIKPFTPANLLASIDLALYNFSQNQVPPQIKTAIEPGRPDFQTLIHQSLFIRVNGKHKKIAPESIRFAEASGSYTILKTDTEQYTISQNLSQFMQKTPLPDLIRIHRSYIVNLKRIDSFDEAYVFVGNQRIPIGESYRMNFMNRIHCI